MCKTIPQMDLKAEPKTNNKIFTIEEALDISGYGKYNYGLLFVCSWMLNAMGLDLFGMSFTVTAAVCDLQLTMEQRGMLSAMPFIGVIAGAHLWGYVSDTRGRKLTLMISMTLGFLFASMSSLSPDWKTMAVIKFFSSCFTSATNSAAYTLLGECCPERYRSKSMLMMTCSLMFSQGTTAALAYPILPLDISYHIPFLNIYFTSWRLLVLVLACPCLITAGLLSLFHESPKFLLTRGREQEAVDVLRQMYCTNTGHSPEDFPVRQLSKEEGATSEGSANFLASVWTQTAPLFQRPLLATTLKLFYMIVVIYMTGSGFIMWLPYIVNNLMATVQSGSSVDGLNICGILDFDIPANTTDTNVYEEICDASIKSVTIISAIAYGLMATGANLIMSMVSGAHKKFAMFVILGTSLVSSILINLINVAIAGVLLFFFFLFIALAMGILSVYFVELYPTHLRGMATCLSVLIGRSSAFVGVNIIGILLNTNCTATFYGWAVFIATGMIAAFFLPSDKKEKPKTTSISL